MNKIYQNIYKLAEAGTLIGRRVWFVVCDVRDNSNRHIIGAKINDLRFNGNAVVRGLSEINEVIYYTDARCWVRKGQVFFSAQEAERTI